MRYPSSISTQIERVLEAVAAWPADVEIKPDEVVRWILQFEEADFGLALRIVQNLNVIGQRNLESGLRIAYSKLSRRAIARSTTINTKNTLFAGIGSAGKSGGMVSYHFRLVNDVSEENFISDDTEDLISRGNIENIVLLDDVVSSGRQAANEINELSQRVLPLGVKNIFLLTVCGMREGLDFVKSTAEADTFSAFEYNRDDTVSSLDSPFYVGIPHEEREALLKRLKHYGEICYRRNPLGYGGIGGLIAFPFNTPNSTVPLVWSTANNWIPLFKRVTRVNGIASYFKQFDKAVEQKAAKSEPAPTEDARQVTLFVEGKRDEMFFDRFVEKTDLASAIGAVSMSVVSVAAAIFSDKLVDILLKTQPHPIFIIEANDPRHVRGRRKPPSDGKSLIELKPSFLGLVDLRKFIKHPLVAARAPRLADLLVIEDRLEMANAIERTFVRAMPFDRAAQFIQIMVDECLDEAAVANFVTELRATFDEQRGQQQA